MPDNTQYTNLFYAFTKVLDEELRRCYWNRFQKEIIGTPNDNVGIVFENDTFFWQSYVWDDDDPRAEQPNFEYKTTDISITATWYKNAGRNFYADFSDTLTIADLANALNTCLLSIEPTVNSWESDPY